MGKTEGRHGKRHARVGTVIAIVIAVTAASAGVAFYAWQTHQSQSTQETPAGAQGSTTNASDMQINGNATGNDVISNGNGQDGNAASAQGNDANTQPSNSVTGSNGTPANGRQGTTSATTTTTTSTTVPTNTDAAITSFVIDGDITQDIDKNAANGRLERNPDTQYMNMLADDGQEGRDACRLMVSLMDASTLQHTDNVKKTIGDDVYLTRTYTGTLRDGGNTVTMIIDMIYSASTGKVGYAYMSSCMKSVMLPSGTTQYVSMIN